MEVEYLAQDHTANDCGSNPVCLFLPIMLPGILFKKREAIVSEIRRVRGERVSDRGWMSIPMPLYTWGAAWGATVERQCGSAMYQGEGEPDKE